MARRVQADLFQRRGRAGEGLRDAPSVESQDAETTGGRGLHSVNFASVPPRSRMDVEDRQRRATDVLRERPEPDVLDHDNEIPEPLLQHRPYEADVHV